MNEATDGIEHITIAAASITPLEASLWSALRSSASGEARQDLFGLHADHAKALARRHFHSRSRGDLDFDDIHQMACAGLLEAIDRFDPSRGVPFRAYATRRIAGSISDGVARSTEVRQQLSARARHRNDRVRSLMAERTDQLSSKDALNALGDLAVGLALGFMLEGTGLFVTDDTEGSDVRAPNTSGYESASWRELVDRLMLELDTLPIRQRNIVRHHYIDGVGFDVLASLIGVSKGRISQLHSAALITLRKRMVGAGHFSLER